MPSAVYLKDDGTFQVLEGDPVYVIGFEYEENDDEDESEAAICTVIGSENDEETLEILETIAESVRARIAKKAATEGAKSSAN
jgi:hypothetical protein